MGPSFDRSEHWAECSTQLFSCLVVTGLGESASSNHAIPPTALYRVRTIRRVSTRDPSTPPSGRSRYCIGGRVPVSILLAKTDEVYAAITEMVAFPDELRFTLTLRERRTFGAHSGLVERHQRALWEFETDDAGLPGPDVAYLSIRDSAGGSVGLEDLDGFDGPPGRYRMPLPPPGPLDFTFVWPSAAIRRVRLGLHAEVLHEAAARSVRLWGGGDTIPTTEYWTGLAHSTTIVREGIDDGSDLPHVPADNCAPPDHLLPGILLVGLPVQRGDDAAARVDAIRAYPVGFAFTVHVVTRDPDPHGAADDDWDADTFRAEHDTARVTFADGRSGAATMWPRAAPGEVAVHCCGSHTDRDRHSATFWVGEVPPRGVVTIVYAFPRMGIDYATFELDGEAIRRAATHARAILDPDPGTPL